MTCLPNWLVAMALVNLATALLICGLAIHAYRAATRYPAPRRSTSHEWED